MTIVAVCSIMTGYFLLPDYGTAIPATGLGLSPAHTWLSPGLAAVLLNTVVSLGIAFMLYILNREFKLMRNSSMAVAGIFMFMQMSISQTLTVFSGGTLMAFVLTACMFLMFSIYNSRDCSLPVYTLFMILGLGSLTFYGYLFYVPVFMIGCMQVRVLSLRTLTAAITGLITPAWILGGFGIMDISAIPTPDITTLFFNIGHHTDIASIKFMATAGFTVLTCLICGIGCIMRTYSYNSRSRSYNGFIYILTLATILLSCIDFGSAIIYIPLLNCVAAYQATHFFITNRDQRSFIGVILILMAYIAFFIWNLM